MVVPTRNHGGAVKNELCDLNTETCNLIAQQVILA